MKQTVTTKTPATPGRRPGRWLPTTTILGRSQPQRKLEAGYQM